MVLVTIAIRNLVQAKRRTLLLSTAIGLVTAMLVLLLSISAGISDNLVRSATTLSSGHVVVAGFYKPSATQGAPLVTDAAKVRKIVEDSTPGLDRVIARGRGWGKIVGPGGSVQSSLSGVTLADEPDFASTLPLAPQSAYMEGGGDKVTGDANRIGEPNSLVLFASHAKRLEVDVGDMVTIVTETQDGRTNTLDVTVVAIAKDMGMLSSWSALVDEGSIRKLYTLKDDTTGALWVYLDDIATAKDTMTALRTTLAQNGYALMDYQPVPFWMKFEVVGGEDWTGQKLDLTTWEDEVSFLTYTVAAFDTVTVFISSILLIIIAIGISNTMFNTVRERTREIGTMRAIGLQKNAVLQLFMLEATLLGLFATTSGALFGGGLALALDAAELPVPIEAMQAFLLSETVNFSVRPGGLLGSVVFLTACTALAALWPSLRAARLKPIVALGYTA